MDNSIYIKQNDPLLLKSLVAQREKYSIAKAYEKGNLALIIITGLFYIVAFVLKCQIADSITSLFAVLFAILGSKFNKKSDELKKQAADIQQFVDCSLFSRVLNQKIEEWGNVPNSDVIVKYIAETKQKSVEEVRNWYEDYSSKSPTEQIFYCQCENVRWSTKLKKELKIFLFIILVIIAFFVVISFKYASSCALKILYLSWSLPIIFYVYDSVSLVRDDIEKYIDIKKELDKLGRIIKSSEGRIDVRKLISIQNKIYERRKIVFLIGDWYYGLRHKHYERLENSIAKDKNNENNVERP